MAMYITRASPLYAQPHTCEIDVLPMDVDESRLAFHAWCSGRADGFRGAAGRLGMGNTLFQPVQTQAAFTSPRPART
jgi:hypothetical protein